MAAIRSAAFLVCNSQYLEIAVITDYRILIINAVYRSAYTKPCTRDAEPVPGRTPGTACSIAHAGECVWNTVAATSGKRTIHLAAACTRRADTDGITLRTLNL